MRTSPLQPASDDEVADALAAILHAAGPPVSREASCYLATVSATYVAEALALAGYVVMRPAEHADQPQLL